MSLKKWNSSFRSIIAAAIEWTGASPHLLQVVLEYTATMSHRLCLPFIKEPSRSVEVVKILEIIVGSPQIQRSNLEVCPEMAQVVASSLIIRDKPPQRAFGFGKMLHHFWVRASEL